VATKQKNIVLGIVGIEATTTPNQCFGNDFFHTDIWSADFTEFKVKLVDFGANGVFWEVMTKNMK
jgi:hypothetical protein